MKAAGILMAEMLIFVSFSQAQPGSLDITFNPGSGETQPSTYCMALQSDGQIIIGGNFTSYNGANALNLARLNPDGSLDSSFGPTVPNSSVQAAVVQLDKKILIGGNFNFVNSLSRYGIARLRPDGSVDTSFDTSLPGPGPNGSVSAIS